MSKKILVTGSNSKIAKNLVKLIPKNLEIQKINSKNFKLENLNEIKKILNFSNNLILFFSFIQKLVLKD